MERVDWRALPAVVDHMFTRHQLTPEEANEAVNDVDAVWYDPDPKSKSGRSARVIGYSPTARAVLTVILLHTEAGPGWYGVNGWRSNARERRIYREEA